MKDVIKYLSEWGLNIHFASMYPPTITQATTVIEEEEEAAGCSSIPAAPPLCAQQLVAQKQRSVSPPSGRGGALRLGSVSAWRPAAVAQRGLKDSWLLMAADGDDDASQTVAGCVLFILSFWSRSQAPDRGAPGHSGETDTNTNNSAVQQKCSLPVFWNANLFLLFFSNNWVTCTQIKVAGFLRHEIRYIRFHSSYKKFLLKASVASQGGLQRRVQDVVLVAVAVGVAVVALRARWRRRLLQTHQHVHLWTETQLYNSVPLKKYIQGPNASFRSL